MMVDPRYFYHSTPDKVVRRLKSRLSSRFSFERFTSYEIGKDDRDRYTGYFLWGLFMLWIHFCDANDIFVLGFSSKDRGSEGRSNHRCA